MGTTVRAMVLSLLAWNAVMAEDKSLSDADLAGMGKASTVLIETAAGTGTGFCIDDRGFFLTNAHVVKDADKSVSLIVAPGEKSQAKLKAVVLRVDEELDLALLKADAGGKVPALKLGTDDGLVETAEVIAFGFPFGKDLALNPGEYPSISVNKGRVTALRKKEGILNRIQLDAVLNPGNSGGPVLSKNGDVIGVVVSGVLGAGAVNFAIPVSHAKKLLESPAISFTPPALTPANLGDALEYKVVLSPSPLATGTYTVELVIDTGRGDPPRKLDMKAGDGGFTVKSAAIPGMKTPGLRVGAVFADGEILGIADDFEFQVGARATRLKEATLINPGEAGSVTLQDGQVVAGAVKKLEAVQIRVGGQTLTVNLGTAKEISVSSAGPAVSLTFTVVVRSGGKEAARTQSKTEFGEEGGATAGPAAGTAPGAASVEQLIAGKFIRPARSTTKTTYLNVLSTAGDYIGQGKRYEYIAKDMTVTPADGLVNVRAGGWALDISPPRGKILKPGDYDGVKRYPFNEANPGLNFSGNGRGSNELTGKFVVWEFVVQGGKVTSLAIDFVQYSEGNKAAPLVGMLRYNSNFK